MGFDRHKFEWDEDNVEHIARHGVEPWEAEEAVADGGWVVTARDATENEKRIYRRRNR